MLTQTQTKAETIDYKRLFEIEKDCKNRAYFFILSCGHLEEYKEYCKTHPVSSEYYSECIAYLNNSVK